jgi:hypothetical protein
MAKAKDEGESEGVLKGLRHAREEITRERGGNGLAAALKRWWLLALQLHRTEGLNISEETQERVA